MAQREPKPPYRPEPRPIDPDADVERVERVERIRSVRDADTVPVRSVRVVGRPLARIVHAVDYAFYLLYGLLAIRLVLAMMGANESAAFTRFIHAVSGPFYAPFERIVSRPAVDGGYFDFPIVIAILAYALLHIAVRGLIRVIEGRSPTL